MAGAPNLKQLTGYKAVDEYVTSGMVVGLGTGSTAYFAVERIGQKLKSGELRYARTRRAARPDPRCCPANRAL